MSSFSYKHKATCLLFFLLVGSAFSQNSVCPFDFLYHLGDGVFDNGNSIRIPPFGRRLPAANLPYGLTTPGTPTGRWCDGLLYIDAGATAMGFPELTPYKRGNATSNDAITFAVARSPVLDRSFFRSRGVRVPPFAASLSIQMSWFKAYLNSICSTPTDCEDKVANSLFLLGDVEANDITIPLIQGKSIREVRGYMSSITNKQINATREIIRLGATRVIIPGNVPIGCYPSVLTELGTNNTKSYDKFGCLKTVNDLIVYKNNNLRKAIADLSNKFPDIMIFYADFYNGYIQLLQETIAGSNKNTTLQACCGVGGKYNYDQSRFCGAQGVPVCSNPSQYIHWDGIHLTEYANKRLSLILQVAAMQKLNCTTSHLKNPIFQVVAGENFKSSPRNL